MTPARPDVKEGAAACSECGRVIRHWKGRFLTHAFQKLTNEEFIEYATAGRAVKECPGTGQAPRLNLEAFGVVM